jgi:hypothetical protein
MPSLIRLQAPKGTDECNIGTARYTVNQDGYFYLPADENIAGLLSVGGFIVAEDQTPSVTVKASRLAELEAEESTLRAERVTPTRLVIPS